MDRDLLPHLPIAVMVARRGGFAAAASELGMSPSAVSYSVRFIEERLGTPLFTRTTRSVSLTEAGALLLEGVTPALQDITDRMERVRSVKGQASGLLRVSVPSVALPIAVMPLLAEMGRRFPDVRVEIYIDNAIVDIVSEGFDAGIRIGELIAEDMVAVRLTPPFKAIIVASPEYISQNGQPQTIADLQHHNCIAFRLIKSGGLYRWDLSEGGQDVSVESGGTTIINDPLYARDFAIAGIGLAYIFEPLVREDLVSKRLVQVLPAAAIEEPGLFLYYTRRASLAPKLRAFIDTAKDMLKAAP